MQTDAAPEATLDTMRWLGLHAFRWSAIGAIVLGCVIVAVWSTRLALRLAWWSACAVTRRFVAMYVPAGEVTFMWRLSWCRVGRPRVVYKVVTGPRVSPTLIAGWVPVRTTGVPYERKTGASLTLGVWRVLDIVVPRGSHNDSVCTCKVAWCIRPRRVPEESEQRYARDLYRLLLTNETHVGRAIAYQLSNTPRGAIKKLQGTAGAAVNGVGMFDVHTMQAVAVDVLKETTPW